MFVFLIQMEMVNRIEMMHVRLYRELLSFNVAALAFLIIMHRKNLKMLKKILQPGQKDIIFMLLKFKSLWYERNFKEFVGLFPEKNIIPDSRLNFKGVPQSKLDYRIIYNAKGNFVKQ